LATHRELDAGRRVGYDYVHCAVDDHTRLAYAEIHPAEKGETCAAFLRRAAAWFAAHGIERIERVMTDIQSGCAALRLACRPAGEDRCRPAPARHRCLTEWSARRLLAC
jgi:hypothetical protein